MSTPSAAPLTWLQLAAQAIADKKGVDLKAYDVRNRSTLTDYYLVATGMNAPHLKALAQEVRQRLKAEGITCFRHSGAPESGWIVADYVNVVFHFFTPAMRTYYALDELWTSATRLKLD